MKNIWSGYKIVLGTWAKEVRVEPKIIFRFPFIWFLKSIDVIVIIVLM